ALGRLSPLGLRFVLLFPQIRFTVTHHRLRRDKTVRFEPRIAEFHSVGATCPTPLWQSMQVALPSSTCWCIGWANSFCFFNASGVNWWQLRQFWELLALYSSQTSFAMRRRSFLNFSSVSITPRTSPIASLMPAFAL